MSNQGGGGGYQRHGNYGRDNYRGGGGSGGGDYRGSGSGGDYNRGRQMPHGGSGNSGGAYGGQHGHQNQNHPAQHHQSRDLRSGPSRGGVTGGGGGGAYSGPSRIGRDNMSSPPQSSGRHGGRNYHTSQHGGPPQPPLNNEYNRERERDRNASSPKQNSVQQPTVSPTSPAQPNAVVSKAPSKEEDKDVIEMSLEIGLGITPTSHCSVLIENSDSQLLFLGDNDGSIAVYDVCDRTSANYFKTKTAVTDLSVTSDQSHIIAAVGQSIFLYNVKTIKERLAEMSESNPVQPHTPTTKKDRLLSKRRIDATTAIPSVSETQSDKEGNAVIVSLKVIDDKLFAGDSEGTVHEYKISKSYQLTHVNSSRLHNTNVTGITSDGTQLITSSSAGTVIFTPISDLSERSQILPCVMELEKKTSATKRAASGLQKAAAYTSTVVCGMSFFQVQLLPRSLLMPTGNPYTKAILVEH